jgi:NADH dehydrogenase
MAERETDPAARRAWLTFVVVGAGPTGVELAGALGELARHTLKHEFRSFDPSEAHVLLLEGADRALPPYPAELSQAAVESLGKLGVEVRTGVQVTGIQGTGVAVRTGETTEEVPAKTVLWAAGMRASPLGAVLAERAGVELDRGGRVIVEQDLTLPGHPDVYVVGDLACFTPEGGKPLPGMAPVAIQQGRFVAERLLRGIAARPRFKYHDKGSMAVIGRNAAVAQMGSLRMRGFLAWMAWTFLHLLYLVEFEDRISVGLRWAWSYFTWNRGARLITAEPAPELPAAEVKPAEPVLVGR